MTPFQNHRFNYIVKRLRQNAEGEFKIIFNKGMNVNGQLGFEISVPKTTAKQTKRCNIEYSSSEEYYRWAIFIPWTDSFIKKLMEQFHKHKHKLENVTSLIASLNYTSHMGVDFINLASSYERDMQETSKTVLESE